MHSVIDEVFRTEWTRLVAILVRDFGDLDLAEDVAQDAFAQATRRWERDGVPDRPGAWLLICARRRAIDRIRRVERLNTLIPLLANDLPPRTPHDPTEHPAIDEQIAVLAGCCHPALSTEAQVALTLRIVGGLSTAQIARAFLVSETSMTRRLSRSKAKIRAAKIPFESLSVATLETRVPAVRSVIASIFTEGHTSARSTELVRGELCDEAIWLGELLARLTGDDPETDGLRALMILTDSRRSTRTDADGYPVLLADQDRSAWDRDKIEHGLELLARAHVAGRGGMFQFQAAIAALHATAPSFEATDWAAIVQLYGVMVDRQPTKLLALNRAVALSQIEGPSAALAVVDTLADDTGLQGDLSHYPYFHAARAELLSELGRSSDSIDAFERAIDCCENEAERRHLERERAAVRAMTT